MKKINEKIKLLIQFRTENIKNIVNHVVDQNQKIEKRNVRKLDPAIEKKLTDKKVIEKKKVEKRVEEKERMTKI